jgi:hypothetical protein
VDILTPRGQQTLEDERAAVALFMLKHPDIQYVHTPKDRECAADAVLVRDGSIIALVETKCRYDMTHEQFILERSGEWLVTLDKLINARALAIQLCVPLVGFLYLVPSKVLLVKSIVNSRGEWLPECTVKQTETQATVNGGRAVRANAFLQWATATQYKEQE